jgi:hypothetical protein
MGQRSLFGASAVIVAALTLAACSSPLPTGAGDDASGYAADGIGWAGGGGRMVAPSETGALDGAGARPAAEAAASPRSAIGGDVR